MGYIKNQKKTANASQSQTLTQSQSRPPSTRDVVSVCRQGRHPARAATLGGLTQEPSPLILTLNLTSQVAVLCGPNLASPGSLSAAARAIGTAGWQHRERTPHRDLAPEALPAHLESAGERHTKVVLEIRVQCRFHLFKSSWHLTACGDLDYARWAVWKRFLYLFLCFESCLIP